MANENQELKWIGTSPVRPDGTDKVTGRAKFGADLMLPGMLTGKVLRSPHAHAKIKSIDTSKAEALPGVKAVVTCADIGEMPSEWVPAGELQLNYRDLASNIMARGKALYDGHAVAAVAATSASIANAALDLIAVDYEVLPHVIDVEEAMAPDAPVLHEDMFTEGVTPTPDKPSNIFKEIGIAVGDVEAGFAAADLIVERSFKTAPVHQGYIEPHAAVASFAEDGQAELWCSTQGHFTARAYCAKLLGMDVSDLRVTASEIGGGFGGKTTVYVEPVALLLSRKAGRPVRVVMTREEVFRASGPTSGAANWVKIGVTKDGSITAGEAVLKYQAGAFPGSPVQPGCMCAFAPYDIENVKVKGYDVVTNRPKVAAYRAPGAPIAEHAVESVLDEIAKKLGMDPIELRQKNAAREGTNAAYGPKFGPIGYAETLAVAKAHPHYSAPLGPNQGRGVASGFWFNVGGDSCATMNVSEDGTLVLATGSPDIGGSRASMAIMAAETLGIDVADVRPIVADTASLGYTFLTGGSRVTFATGMAVIEASKQIAEELRQRAAKIWDISVDAVVWEDGYAKPAGANAGDFEPLSLADIAATANRTGGPITAAASLNAEGAGP
ncbi:MAG TPA: xanthine dehydrogenase family protein molybdopterin-binding subunit, partial [Alphaproteobacteria bacterium]|nr:xanthine dehydrogenase family protein molybdopterin-binding subunit [Alphaproteobacteria bacterium]